MEKKNGFYFYFIWVCLIVLNTILAVAMILQYNYYQKENTAIYENHFLTTSDKIKDNLHSYFTKTDALASMLADNAEALTALAESEDYPIDSELSSSFVESFNNWFDEIPDFTGSNPLLFFKASGYSLNPLNTRFSEQLSGFSNSAYAEQMGLTAEQFSLLTDAEGDSFVYCVAEKATDDSETLYKLAIAQEIYPGVVLITEINLDSVQDFLHYTYMEYDSMMFLFTDENACIAVFDDSGLTTDFTVPEFEKQDERQTILYQGNQYYAYYNSIDNTDINQLILLQDIINTDQAAVLYYFIIFIFISWILIWIGISYLLTKRICRPLRELISRVSQGNNIKKLGNEFSMIDLALDTLESNNVTIQEKLNKQSKQLVDSVLLKILRNSSKISRDDYSVLKNANFPLQCLKYFILLINFDFFRPEQSDYANGENITDEIKSEYSSLKNMIESVMLQAGYKTYMLQDRESLVCVAGYDKIPAIDISECCMTVNQKQKDEFPLMEISIAVSSLHKELDELDRAYAETSLLIVKPGTFQQYNNLLLDNAYSCNQLLQMIGQLSFCIQANKFGESIRILSELEKMCEDNFSPSFSLTKQQLLYIIVDTSILSLSSNADIEPKIIKQISNQLEQKKDKTTIKDIIKILKEIEWYFNKGHSKKVNIQDIVEYIQNNYQNHNLSAGMVAEFLNISPAWLSIQFKNNFEIGFLDYVHTCRIEKAIELIQNSDKNISEISEIVGYTSIVTMIRAFKKYKGVTPKWYRSNTD